MRSAAPALAPHLRPSVLQKWTNAPGGAPHARFAPCHAATRHPPKSAACTLLIPVGQCTRAPSWSRSRPLRIPDVIPPPTPGHLQRGNETRGHDRLVSSSSAGTATEASARSSTENPHRRAAAMGEEGAPQCPHPVRFHASVVSRPAASVVGAIPAVLRPLLLRSASLSVRCELLYLPLFVLRHLPVQSAL
ncbi:hypothetical protein PYCCODRAFT_688867 [Trametes coccinea BRFM310]|uniref:Uncharacterized protein n=1 Tax=Trametes coccinea (strain BRFM310) TaxID=1353009 RepID=A0A1Y2IH57_TRAC3|nr:hypothetical protein PYCCODRAFT_688867 [Trametes coccinea BRFM310]